MKLIVRMLLAGTICMAHIIGMYYFYVAHWVDKSEIIIVWVSMIQVGLTMSLIFYLGLVININTNGKYYNLHKIEDHGRIYEKLGIRQFKFILFHSPFVFLNKNLKVNKFKKSQVAKLEEKMRIVEFGHLVGFILILLISPLMSLRNWKFAIWLVVFNILFHLYPIFLQRYNRQRINKIKELNRT